VVADVSGKGVPGLVVMAMVKVLTRELLTSGNSPAGVLRNLNSAVQKHIGKNMFVTLFLAILDTDTGTLVCTNAGHNPVLIYDHDADSVRFFKMAGVPLGVFDGASFDATVRDYHLALKPGDVVLQYTDGLNESKGENGERLKLSGIETVARRCAGRGARVLVQELVREESGFRGNTSQYDDIALLALGLVGTPLAAGREAVVEEVAVR
jgi:sigma-B regulation protein RsbU (phosphoserine phosphatase)